MRLASLQLMLSNLRGPLSICQYLSELRIRQLCDRTSARLRYLRSIGAAGRDGVTRSSAPLAVGSSAGAPGPSPDPFRPPANQVGEKLVKRQLAARFETGSFAPILYSRFPEVILFGEVWGVRRKHTVRPVATAPTKHKFVTCRGVEGGALVDEPGGSVRKHCTDTRNTENTAACTSACTILRFVAMTLGIRILHGVHSRNPRGFCRIITLPRRRA